MSKTRGRFYFFAIAKPENRTVPLFSKAVTLVELIVAVTIVSVIILGIYNIDTYTHNQVINTQRRTVVQNELSYALEHMGKYVQQALGNVTRPAIEYFPPGNPNGFRVWVDTNMTPGNTGDDSWVRYRIFNNNIRVNCGGPGGCPPNVIDNEDLVNDRILANFSAGPIPDPFPIPPAVPTAGFFAEIGDSGSSVDIVLTGCFDPANIASLRNPQVTMRTKLICNSCSTN